ncbi:MAG: hypothetical protein CMO01_11150 [Thalassobius sp.]|nr:hypothetical protein [Thalassovita sp.]
MDYKHYKIEDFVLDKSFEEWVNGKNQESIAFWEKWKMEHPERENEIAQAKEMILNLRFKSSDISANLIEDKIRVINEKIDNKNNETGKVKSMSPQYKNIAATILLLLVAGYTLWFFNKEKYQKKEETIAKYLDKTTSSGQKINVTLTDGTVVKLNSQSKLKVPEKFTANKREVFLEGEAFFEVEKDASKPFLVHTGELVTMVKGTAFNIAAYNDDEEIRVAVSEGSVGVIVKMKNDYDTLDLLPNDMVIYNKANELAQKVTFDTRKEIGWKDGIIYFENANVAEIFPYLEKWYGVKINVEKQEEILGSFVGEFQDENLDNVLRVMGNALGFNYRIENKVVHIKPSKYD